MLPQIKARLIAGESITSIIRSFIFQVALNVDRSGKICLTMLENMAPLLETEEAKQLEIEQRQAIANEWLEAAEEVALNSGLDLALEVGRFSENANRFGYRQSAGLFDDILSPQTRA